MARLCIQPIRPSPTLDVPASGDYDTHADQSKEQLIGPRQTRENVLTCNARIGACIHRAMMPTASSTFTRITIRLLAVQGYR
jgi:hypothetical protein